MHGPVAMGSEPLQLMRRVKRDVLRLLEGGASRRDVSRLGDAVRAVSGTFAGHMTVARGAARCLARLCDAVRAVLRRSSTVFSPAP